MGNLSEHYNREEFCCTCGRCRNMLKISLTLVGILEDLAVKFATKPVIKRGFVCDDTEVNEPGPRKNYHGNGRAIDFTMPPEKLIEVFRYLETFPEISGLGLAPNNYIHIDLREKAPTKWVYVREAEVPLTNENRAEFGLGEPVTNQPIIPVTIDMPVEAKP